jgi:hypothetical protein
MPRSLLLEAKRTGLWKTLFHKREQDVTSKISGSRVKVSAVEAVLISVRPFEISLNFLVP